ncbi:CsbD family protein [Bradyrhizobium tunisiense]|uniref:CsbD family protein n=1 Tax=Bradyrhizobium tunisiense TaxID=3278709 RepID=UPI0035DB314B
MSKMKGLTQRIAGKAKQAAGEIIGDQDLHEQGKVEAESGRDHTKTPSQPNPPKELKH